MYGNELGRGSKYFRERMIKKQPQRMKDKISRGYAVQISTSNPKSGLIHTK